MSEHIEDVKRQIEEYNVKISDLMRTLNDISSKNLVEQPRIYFDKELIEDEIKFRKSNFIPETFPLFLVVFYCCVGLLLGKIINRFI